MKGKISNKLEKIFITLFSLFLTILIIVNIFTQTAGARNSATSWEWHKSVARLYGIPDPFQIPPSHRPEDLENMNNCQCPRVYWPCCGRDNVTYVNHCIANCLHIKVRRMGPCINYRRDNTYFKTTIEEIDES